MSVIPAQVWWQSSYARLTLLNSALLQWMGDSDKFLGEITEKQENGKKIGTPDSTPQV